MGDGLPIRIQAAYCCGQLGLSILINLVSFWLVYVYNPPSEVGLPLLVAPLLLTLIVGGGRLFDAVTDPAIAQLSDRASFDRGRRIPFLLVGGLPAALFCVLLFVPPEGGVTAINAVWLAVASVLFYLFLTTYGTPYFALIPELSSDTDDRVNLATAVAVGWALGLVIAAQASTIWNAVYGATALSRMTSIQVTMGAIATLAVILLYVPVVAIDERRYVDAEPCYQELRPTLRKFARNREFLSYVVADFAYFAGMTITITGLPYYTTVLLFPERQSYGESLVGQLTIAIVLTWVLVYPLANLLAKRIGKKPLIRASFGSLGGVFVLVFFLGTVPIPPIYQAYAVALLAGIPMAFLAVLPNAALADVARHDAGVTGENQEGMFFAARTLIQKLGQAAGVGLFAGLLTVGDGLSTLTTDLTFLGTDLTDAIGIRLSGVVGAVLCLGAFVAFRYYREDKLDAELATMEATERAGRPGDD